MSELPDGTADSRDELVCPDCGTEGLEAAPAYERQCTNEEEKIIRATQCPNPECSTPRVKPDHIRQQYRGSDDDQDDQDTRISLKLSASTGEETRTALKQYRDAHDLDSFEDAIRHLLPEWAFGSMIDPTIAALINESDRFTFDDIGLVDPMGENTESSRLNQQSIVRVAGTDEIARGVQPLHANQLVDGLRDLANQCEYDLSTATLWDIDSLRTIDDAGFGTLSTAGEIDGMGEWCERRSDSIERVDTIEVSVEGCAHLLDHIASTPDGTVLALLPEGESLSMVADPDVPAAISLHESMA